MQARRRSLCSACVLQPRLGSFGSLGSIGSLGCLGSIGSLSCLGCLGSIGSIGSIGAICCNTTVAASNDALFCHHSR